MQLKPGKEVVLTISDLQFPFHHPDTFDYLSWLSDEVTPTKIVCIGDEMDFHGLSRYEHDPDGHSAGRELDLGLECMKQLYELFPTVYAVTSNHTARPFRKAFSAGIPKVFLKEYKDFLKAPPGWEWRDSWNIDGVHYFHGEGLGGSNPMRQAVLRFMQPVVFGHVHAHAGIYYYSTATELIFGFNVGCLIDEKAYAFAYSKNMASRSIIGCGIIDKGVPRFVPMLLDKDGRWIRKKSKNNSPVIRPKVHKVKNGFRYSKTGEMVQKYRIL